MSHIVSPKDLSWQFRVTDDGKPDALVTRGGQDVQPLATYATDASGNITGLAVSSTMVSPLVPVKMTAVTLGSSITRYNSPINASGSSATQVGGVATYNVTSHTLGPGQQVCIRGFDSTSLAYNGLKTVIARLSANAFTAAVDSSAPATGVATTIQTSPFEYADTGFFAWYQAKAKQPFKWLNNAGFGGDTTAGMYSRMETDVLAFNPGWLFVEGGSINDIIAGTTVGPDTTEGTITNSLKKIFQKALGNGIRVVVYTMMPLGSGHASFNATTSAAICEVNTWTKQYAFAYPGITVVDAYAVVVDPATNGAALSNYLISDNLHQSTLGAQKVGFEIDRVLSASLPIPAPLISNTADSFGQSSTSNQMFDNPVGKTATGGTVNTGFSGTLGANWTASRTVGLPTGVCAVVSRSDGVGNDMQVNTIASSAASDWYSLTTSALHTRFSPGDYVECYLSMKSSSSTVTQQMQFRMTMAVDGVTYNRYLMKSIGVGMTQVDLDLVWYGKFRIPTGSSLTSLVGNWDHIFSASGGSQTIQIGRFSVRKVSA